MKARCKSLSKFLERGDTDVFKDWDRDAWNDLETKLRHVL
jgi:hypothetical protein